MEEEVGLPTPKILSPAFVIRMHQSVCDERRWRKLLISFTPSKKKRLFYTYNGQDEYIRSDGGLPLPLSDAPVDI